MGKKVIPLPRSSTKKKRFTASAATCASERASERTERREREDEFERVFSSQGNLLKERRTIEKRER